MIHTFGVTNVDSAADSIEELPFLKAIWASYADPMPKLIYADWLDERSDSRADFLRRFVNRLEDWHSAPLSTENLPRGWCHGIGARAVEMLRNQGLGEIEQDLLARARPCVDIAIVPRPDKEIPAGASKLGGWPDLPVGTPWPMLTDGTEVPYWFCAQVRLSDLRLTMASEFLPRRGLLSVFAYRDVGLVRLFYEEGPFYRPWSPFAPAEDPGRYPIGSGLMTFHETMDLPVMVDHFAEVPAARVVEQLRQFGELEALWHQLHAVAPNKSDLYWPESFRHSLLGYHPPANGPEEIPAMKHLIHFGDEEKSLGLWWGDSGKLYFVLSTAALQAGRFEEAQMCCG